MLCIVLYSARVLVDAQSYASDSAAHDINTDAAANNREAYKIIALQHQNQTTIIQIQEDCTAECSNG